MIDNCMLHVSAEIAICSPNFVQVGKGRDQNTVFLQGET